MTKEESIKNELKKSFKFLLDKGFQIKSFEYYSTSFGDWSTLFQSPTILIRVYSDRGDVNIIFSQPNEERWFGLSTIIFFSSKREKILELYQGSLSDRKGQIEKQAEILFENYTNILSVMGENFQINYDKLLEAEKDLLDIYKKKFRERDY